FFFFQAEDGIRDYKVTGVQTCALPIFITRATYPVLGFPQYPGEVGTSEADDDMKAKAQKDAEAALAEPLDVYRAFFLNDKPFIEIGRASCREREEMWGGKGCGKKKEEV